jgi:hypothetical protein
MYHAKFTLKFNGPAVENGEIDIQDLVPPIMAIGEIIQLTNTHFNNDRAKITVKFQATGKGSVDVHLSIVQSLIEQAATLLLMGLLVTKMELPLLKTLRI